jgi:hypothetical protein
MATSDDQIDIISNQIPIVVSHRDALKRVSTLGMGWGGSSRSLGSEQPAGADHETIHCSSSFGGPGPHNPRMLNPKSSVRSGSERRASAGDVGSEMLKRSTLVPENNALDVSWFASRGLMSKKSFKVYKKEQKLQRSKSLPIDNAKSPTPSGVKSEVMTCSESECQTGVHKCDANESSIHGVEQRKKKSTEDKIMDTMLKLGMDEDFALPDSQRPIIHTVEAEILPSSKMIEVPARGSLQRDLSVLGMESSSDIQFDRFDDSDNEDKQIQFSGCMHKANFRSTLTTINDTDEDSEILPETGTPGKASDSVLLANGGKQVLKRSNSARSGKKRSLLAKRSRSLPYLRSVSLDDGLESIAELFVASLIKSSESEKRTAFANLVLNANEAQMLNGLAMRLSQTSNYDDDDETDSTGGFSSYCSKEEESSFSPIESKNTDQEIQTRPLECSDIDCTKIDSLYDETCEIRPSDDCSRVMPQLHSLFNQSNSQDDTLRSTAPSTTVDVLEEESNAEKYHLESITSGDNIHSDKKDTALNALHSSFQQDECPTSIVPQNENILEEGIEHLSIAMLVLLYRKLREMSMLGHVSAKLRDIDVNSYQAISRQKELKRCGLMPAEEESKGYLDRTQTCSFIVRTVQDEHQMFHESNYLLPLNPTNELAAEYDAR